MAHVPVGHSSPGSRRSSDGDENRALWFADGYNQPLEDGSKRGYNVGTTKGLRRRLRRSEALLVRHQGLEPRTR
jgi:hypothetical protein